MAEKKILILPHHPPVPGVKIRLLELAKALSSTYGIYVLNWHAAAPQGEGRSGWQGVLQDLCRPMRFYAEDFYWVVETPFLRRPRAWAASFNSRPIQKAVVSLGIDVVVNGSYYLYAAPAKRGFTYVVDIADVPFSDRRRSFDRMVDRRLSQEAAKADAITVSSHGLIDIMQDWYSVPSHFLPNGTDLNRFQAVAGPEVDRLRTELGFDGKWVISYIGVLGHWVDLNFLIAVFQEVRRRMPEAALLIVGGGPAWRDLQRRHASDAAIKFTGPVSPQDVERYFLVSDAGVLPAEKSAFQDMAFHIKLVEYGAAKKFVVCSDLKEVERLDFPNVRVASLKKELWSEALVKLKEASWRPEWNALFEAYDWRHVAASFRNIIEKKG